MIIENTFSVSRPIDQAWDLLTDIERIAPCMPGARLTEVEGGTYYGEVRVRIGPVQTRFQGQASFEERDAASRRAVIAARGKDTGGKGLASATITAQLTPGEDGVTTVAVSTDLTISGKIAQFGRGAVADVSTKLLTQFADCLESRLQGDTTAEEAGTATRAAPVGTAPTGEGTPGESDEGAGATEPTPDQAASETGGTDQGTRAEPSQPEPTEPAPPEPGSTEPEPTEPAPGEAESTEPAGDEGERTAEAEEPAGQAQPTQEGRRKIDAPEPEPIDLMRTAGESVTRSLVPIAIIAVLIAIVVVLVII